MDVSEAVLTPLRFLERSATVWADRPAVVSGEDSWTYAEHLEQVRRVAGGLRELGVEPGDRVATLLPNVHEMLELHYAVPGIGAVLVPLNTRLTKDDYAYILEHSGAKVAVVAEALRWVRPASGMTPSECRYAPRWFVITPFGRPVVPEV